MGVRSRFWLYGVLFTLTAAFVAAEALGFSDGHEDGIAAVAHAERSLKFVFAITTHFLPTIRRPRADWGSFAKV